jgi:hypothetical protein
MLTVVTPPAEEPISLEQAKAHLRVEIADDDALIAALVTAARLHCEKELRQALVTTGFRYTLDGFPTGYGHGYTGYGHGYTGAEPEWPAGQSLARIELPRPPLIAVSSVAYVDPQGATVTLDPSAYEVEAGTPGRLYPAYGTSWPAARRKVAAVTIAYTAGYGAAAAVPEVAKAAIKVALGHLYEHRDDDAPIPDAVDLLLAALDHGSYA